MLGPGLRRCLGTRHAAAGASLRVRSAAAAPLGLRNAGTAQPAAGAQASKPRNLQRIRHVLAVASGKGGVGKSSVSVNLAYLLAGRGAKVGILDADIYGPSLPVLLPLEVKGVYASESGGIVPLEHDGVRLMSMGYARPNEHAALRGPLVSSMVQQLLTQTEWGELDYLVIDMPPGTGDVHLTVAQSAQVDAAIVVSTPQALALADVDKGIAMFNKVSIPTIAVAENMSYFICTGCGVEHWLFDEPGRSRVVAERFGVPAFVRLPLDPALSAGRGVRPYIRDPAHAGRPLAAGLAELADAAERELTLLTRGAVRRTLVVASSTGPQRLELRRASGQGEEDRFVLPARAVRLACRSAKMWDEITGEKLFREEDIPLDVQAKQIRPAGSYAVHIDWSDGHNSLMPFASLEALAGAPPR